VNAINPQRTLYEKIMSLVRFSFAKNPVDDLRNKVRHLYDICMLLKNEEINSYFYSQEFSELLFKVACDDIFIYKNNNDWLLKHPKTAIIFSDYFNVWTKIKATYFSTFKELVYGTFADRKRNFGYIENFGDPIGKY